MSLSRRIRQVTRRLGRMWSAEAGPPPARASRVCRVEQMEPRRLLAFSVLPIHLGAVYLEEASGDDSAGDVFEITWSGGQENTQLTRLVIDTDKAGDGLTAGDCFFDTAPGGRGEYGHAPLAIGSLQGIDSVQVEVLDGGTSLVLTFTGFDAGDRLVFSIDVDEALPDNSKAEGAEFAGSIMTATFSAPHYHDVTDSDVFVDRYDASLAASGLDLPGDDYVPPAAESQADYTAGAFVTAEQTPLPITIRGTVFEDVDLDNRREAGEPGLAGVEVALFRLEGTDYVDTGLRTTTDGLGRYAFSQGVDPGTYRVFEVQPGGFFSVGAQAGTVGGQTRGTVTDADTISGIAMLGGEDSSDNDFGEARPASIRGRVHAELNGDCVWQPGEPLLSGVTVHLLDAQGTIVATTQTDAQGEYSFTDLMPGTYGVMEIQPAGYFDGPDHPGSEGGRAVPPDSILDVTLLSGTQAVHYDFCEALPNSIRGRVHVDRDGDCEHDPGEPLLAGVTLELLDGQGSVIRTTQTDAQGEYLFDNLAPGTYAVREIQPVGYDDGPDRVGSAGGQLQGPDSIAGIQLRSNVHGVRYDFCELERMDLSGYVYVDDNNTGTKDPGEAGIAGATVRLLDAQGNLLRTTTTDASGFYEFTDLLPGTYSVAEVQPAGYFDGKDTAGSLGGVAHNPGDRITQIVGGPNDHGAHYNFGELRPARIGGRVHAELNGDCIPQPGEPLLSGVTVHLLDAQGSILDSTRTDAAGEYQFAGLEPFKQYGVLEVQPAGYLQGRDHVGSAGGINAAENLITQVTLGSGEDAVQYNFCEMTPARISGYVFQDGPVIELLPGEAVPDVATVRDGRFTSDDSPIAGATIQLWRDGRIVATTTTDSRGYFQFDALPFGEYTLREVQPAGYLDGLDHAGTHGGYADNPGDAIAAIHLRMGDSARSYTFSEVAVRRDFIPPNDTPDPTPILPPPGPAPARPMAGPPPAAGLSFVMPPIELAGPGGALPDYAWHLSVVNAGRPRQNHEAASTAGVVSGPLVLVHAEAFRDLDLDEARWSLGDGRSGPPAELFFGREGAIPVTGDFDGDGRTDLGVFIDGEWFIDLSGNGRWDEGDVWAKLGEKGDIPVTGDWDGDGKTDIGIYGPEWARDELAASLDPGLPDAENPPTDKPKNVPPEPEEATNGERHLRRTARGELRSDVIDHVFLLGNNSFKPVTGDFNGDGVATIGIFRGGAWKLDVNGDGLLDESDLEVHFGDGGDLPVVGDWDGDGMDDLGVYRDGLWYLDLDGDHALTEADRPTELGAPGDVPVVGDWDGDGRDEPGLYQPGVKRSRET